MYWRVHSAKLLYIPCCHEFSPQAPPKKFICQQFGRAPWPEGWPNVRSVLTQDNKKHKHRYIHLPMCWDEFKLMILIWNYYNPTELYCTMTADMFSPFTCTWHCYSPFPHAEGKKQICIFTLKIHTKASTLFRLETTVPIFMAFLLVYSVCNKCDITPRNHRISIFFFKKYGILLLWEYGGKGEQPHVQCSELEAIIKTKNGNDSANEITTIIRMCFSFTVGIWGPKSYSYKLDM